MHLEGGNVPGNQISAGTKGHDLRQPPRIDAPHFAIYRSKHAKVLRHIFFANVSMQFSERVDQKSGIYVHPIAAGHASIALRAHQCEVRSPPRKSSRSTAASSFHPTGYSKPSINRLVFPKRDHTPHQPSFGETSGCDSPDRNGIALPREHPECGYPNEDLLSSPSKRCLNRLLHSGQRQTGSQTYFCKPGRLAQRSATQASFCVKLAPGCPCSA